MRVGISDDFVARGEQLRRIVEYQKAQRLAILTAYADDVVAGKTPSTQSSQPAQPARSYTRRLVFFCALYFVAGLTVGLAIGKAVLP